MLVFDSRNGERPSRARGVQEIGFCTGGYISVTSPFNRWYITPLQDGNSEHFEFRPGSGLKG